MSNPYPSSEQARQRFDALLAMVALLAKHCQGFRPAPAVVEMMRELSRDAFTISASGNAPAGSGRLDPVTEWLAPQAAGAEVGCTGRRVRQLAADGLVRSRKIDGRTLVVDVADLRRHFRGRAA